MHDIYESYCISQKEPGKSHFGDYCHSELFGDILIAVLSDGVGSRPCDWLASKTTCDKFVELAGKLNTTSLTAEELMHICAETDRFVSNPPDHCKGMMATLSAVIWNTKESEIHLINVGDSRIFLIDAKGKIKQLSTDDIKPINMRSSDGKLLSSGGSTIIRSGLTNAFGLNSVSVQPSLHAFNPGDTLILVSDGFYNCSAFFEEEIMGIAAAPVIEQAVNKIMRSYSDKQDDDATISVVRYTRTGIDIPTDLKQLDFGSVCNNLSHFQLTHLMNKKLRQCIAERNYKLALETMNIIESEKLFPAVETLNELLDIMVHQEQKNEELMSRIIKIIRLLMKSV